MILGGTASSFISFAAAAQASSLTTFETISSSSMHLIKPSPASRATQFRLSTSQTQHGSIAVQLWTIFRNDCGGKQFIRADAASRRGLTQVLGLHGRSYAHP